MKFVKHLFALEKTLGVTRYEFSRMTGKHRDVLKNWQSGKTKPDAKDITSVSKKLTKVLAEHKRAIRVISEDADTIEYFLSLPYFDKKKVSC